MRELKVSVRWIRKQRSADGPTYLPTSELGLQRRKSVAVRRSRARRKGLGRDVPGFVVACARGFHRHQTRRCTKSFRRNFLDTRRFRKVACTYQRHDTQPTHEVSCPEPEEFGPPRSAISLLYPFQCYRSRVK